MPIVTLAQARWIDGHRRDACNLPGRNQVSTYYCYLVRPRKIAPKKSRKITSHLHDLIDATTSQGRLVIVPRSYIERLLRTIELLMRPSKVPT